MDAVESVARAAVAEAGTRLRAAWREHKVISFKGPVDLVTETDREVEALVIGHLRRAFPAHQIVAEETASDQPDNQQPTWYLDPLDGTTNFAHGYPHFAVSLAFAEGGELRFGIVHDPVRDETFVAHRGGGASLNGAPISVSPVSDLNQALLGTGFPYDRRERTDYYLAFIRRFLQHSQDVRRAGSAALDLCHVACGRFEGFWEWKLRPWDTAAGVLIVREAGGVVTDFTGNPFSLRGEQTLASNGHVHGAMVEVLTAVLGQGRG
ncbi:MAG: inositol monophosphatase [Deltaproteobacteria bacterium]|nr:inositol monophosphatase [Deltaproteobacteria bacterium]